LARESDFSAGGAAKLPPAVIAKAAKAASATEAHATDERFIGNPPKWKPENGLINAGLYPYF